MLPPVPSSTLLLPPRHSRRSLQTLKRMALTPSKGSMRGEWVRALDRIEHIEVRPAPSGDRGVFTIDVYLRRSVTRAPASVRLPVDPAAEERAPDISTTRRYSDFIKLRRVVWKHAVDGHYWKRCQFCEKVVQFMQVDPDSQPTTRAKWAMGQQQKIASLTAFVRLVLDLALPLDLPPTEIENCRGQTKVPRLVYEFLLTEQTPV